MSAKKLTTPKQMITRIALFRSAGVDVNSRLPAGRLASKELPTHQRLEDRQRPEHQQQRDAANANRLRRDAVANPLPNSGAQERRKNSLGHHRGDCPQPHDEWDDGKRAAIVAAVI